MSRLIMRMVVVLPQPDGPTSTQTSPSATSRDSSRTATVPSPYRLVTPSRRIIVGHGSRDPAGLRSASVPATRVPLGVAGLVSGQPWVKWQWVHRHPGIIYHALREHLILTGLAVGIGLLIAL